MAAGSDVVVIPLPWVADAVVVMVRCMVAERLGAAVTGMVTVGEEKD